MTQSEGLADCEVSVRRLTAMVESNSFNVAYLDFPHPETTMIADIRKLISRVAAQAPSGGIPADPMDTLNQSLPSISAAVAREVAIEESAKIAENWYADERWHPNYKHAGMRIASGIRAMLEASPDPVGKG